VNRLADETSPYLRQHKDNPVDWWPWGPAALAEAASRDVPVLLSVGYSACHWCHVMAHECFEDAEVAAAMNAGFVCIKVDREERPDVDSVYMDAVQAISGHGGWPMTVFLAPDGRPFYGGTYFPKPNFLQLMGAVTEAWEQRRDELLAQGDQLVAAISRTSAIQPADDLPGIEALNAALAQLGERFDPQWGGFGPAPKFPSTMSLDLVARVYASSGSEAALEILTTSLDAMASGGMYDHIGGGFARYSVDPRWLVPHFEKMLYDQALLLRAYVHGWQLTGNERWRQVAEEVVAYVERDLRRDSGGIASAEDADSPDEHGHGHEGLFHTWTPAEVRAVLDEPAATAVMAWFDISDAGNFEGRSIPNRMHARGQFARPADIEDARRQLFDAREKRPRPGLDDKVLTEWNALWFGALAEAGAAFDRPDWVRSAEDIADFLCTELRSANGRWRRSFQAAAPSDADGRRARHDALAADHGALVEAFVSLAQASGRARWIDEAVAVAEVLVDHFWDADLGGVYTTAADGEVLVARQKDLMDNATPSANSMAALGLLRLAALTGHQRYANLADQILRLVGNVVGQAPSAFSHLLAAAALRAAGATEIAVVGHRPDLVRAVHERFLPNAVLAWGEPYDSPLWEGRRDGHAYVCRDYACQAPVTDVDALLGQLAG
jgi:uncharacterized protein YyaL (SSP411 family)